MFFSNSNAQSNSKSTGEDKKEQQEDLGKTNVQPAGGNNNNSDIKVSGSPTEKGALNVGNSKQRAVVPNSPTQISQKDLSKASNLDLMTHLTSRANRALTSAMTKAREVNAVYVDSEHLLYGLLLDNEIYNLFTQMKISPQSILDKLNSEIKKQNNTKEPSFSPRIKKIIQDALVLARKAGFEFISPEHLLLALYEEGEGVGARVLAGLGVKKEDLSKAVLGKKKDVEGEEKKEQEKSALLSYTIDLTEKAKQGLLDPVVERSEVIERVIHILSRRRKNNPALIGEAGVGKTAIVEGLAQSIVDGKVPEILLGKKILQLDLMSLVAGASHRGEFEERMKKLIAEIKAADRSIILFVDEMHNLVGAGGGEGSLDASNFLKPALARGEIQMIGATTIDEYRKYIDKDPALERRFQPVMVPEPTVEQAIMMLKALKGKYEAYHKVKIPDDVIETAVKLSKKYVGDRFLPDKAVDLIDEAASAVRLPLISLPEEMRSLDSRIKELQQELKEVEAHHNKVQERILRSQIDELMSELKEKKEEYEMKKARTTTEVTKEIVREIISSWTGIPISKITESETEKLANLEKIMHKRLIDQEKAVVAVAEAIRRGRAGLKAPNRPVGSFVFLGPTGVGKTELAKTLAEVLFGKEDALIRFDMTEYMEKHEVAKLLGAPPGYVGYEEGGKLTEAVRRKPYSVVLFDEIEKAHPDIFNILLQILDDGRLTDNKGHVVSFKETVVICTSNIGSKIIQKELSKDKVTEETYKEMKKKVMSELGKFFRPELINRFDEVIVFEPLGFSYVKEIVKLQLKGVRKLLEDQNIGFQYNNEAVEKLAQEGYDPVYGARPLRRTIQRLVENPISTLIIRGKVKDGDVINLGYKNERLTFDIERVEMVDKSKIENSIKKFRCEKCGNEFETEVIKNSTPVCSRCASSDVVIIEGDKKEISEEKIGDKHDERQVEEKTRKVLDERNNSGYNLGAVVN